MIEPSGVELARTPEAIESVEPAQRAITDD
jgi:hypothetical protein